MGLELDYAKAVFAAHNRPITRSTDPEVRLMDLANNIARTGQLHSSSWANFESAARTAYHTPMMLSRTVAESPSGTIRLAEAYWVPIPINTSDLEKEPAWSLVLAYDGAENLLLYAVQASPRSFDVGTDDTRRFVQHTRPSRPDIQAFISRAGQSGDESVLVRAGRDALYVPAGSRFKQGVIEASKRPAAENLRPLPPVSETRRGSLKLDDRIAADQAHILYAALVGETSVEPLEYIRPSEVIDL